MTSFGFVGGMLILLGGIVARVSSKFWCFEKRKLSILLTLSYLLIVLVSAGLLVAFKAT